MKPIDFPESNKSFGPPAGWTEEQCSTVRAYGDEKIVIVAWQPSPEDLARLAAGGPIWLTFCMSGGLAPHALSTESPFKPVEIAPETHEPLA